jgi:hypothetical protein
MLISSLMISNIECASCRVNGYAVRRPL